MVKKLILFAIVLSILTEVVPVNGTNNTNTYRKAPIEAIANSNSESGIITKENGNNNTGTNAIKTFNEIFALNGGYGADEVSFKNTVITVGRYMYHVISTTKGFVVEIINGFQNV